MALVVGSLVLLGRAKLDGASKAEASSYTCET